MSDKLILKMYRGLPVVRKFHLRRDGERVPVAGYRAELHIAPPGHAEIVCDATSGRLTLDEASNEWTLSISDSDTASYEWEKAPLYLLLRQPNGEPLDPVKGWAVTEALV